MAVQFRSYEGIRVKEKHITCVISITGVAQVALTDWTPTPPAYRGSHVFTAETSTARYYVRLIGVNGWLLPDWANQQAMQVVRAFLQSREQARR